MSYKSIVWRCVSRLEEKGSDCSSPTVNEVALQNSIIRAINQVLCEKGNFISILRENIITVLNEENDVSLEGIGAKMEEMQNELLRLANSKARYESVADEIYRLRELKQRAIVHNAERQGQRQRFNEMNEFLLEQSGVIHEFDEQLVRKLIEKVTVFDDMVTVEFKSGVKIEVNR